MVSHIKKLFGIGAKVDFKQLLRNGAVIIDVRSAGEYASGHIKGSQNIPHTLIKNYVNMLKKDAPIITCCATGLRSASARSLLLANGFKQVYNAGKWSDLLRYT